MNETYPLVFNTAWNGFTDGKYVVNQHAYWDAATNLAYEWYSTALVDCTPEQQHAVFAYLTSEYFTDIRVRIINA